MMSLRIPALFLIVSSMGLLLPLGESIWLTLPPLRTKCVSEEIQNGVSVLAKYNVISADQIGDGPAITVKVTSPSGSNIYRVENATDDWIEFNTTEAGKYLVCFWMGDYHQDEEASVYLDWKIGIATRDWDSVAKEEKLLGVELELRKQEEIVESIHEKMLRLMGRTLKGLQSKLD
uniref:GOLD domain-containing protein n=1 Tax=Nelumbo nucifera TaxID=4432 RepID=A0A822YZU0_NELNU|nr:TPA_asm: hypothetical protein HUJ06_013937 [Nelumbo nucifera]